MKKSILAVLLMFALVVPALAETLEVVGKVGYGLNAKVTNEGDSLDVNSPFMVGAEGYIYVIPGLGLGAGINNIFDAEVKDSEDLKIGATNIYVSVKPKLGFIADVYLLGQLGYGLVRIPDVPKIENGIYWGVGAGVELMSFVVELLYSNNNFKIIPDGDPSISLTYSVIALNVGYKFSI
ncbi:MAG: outer membrane beta-barrel protein [Endomicrobiaceae bacterium]|nr:outer membrane beta-barrel protein [Endomicrobiaceae bacterium]